jgi:hypothetical protein
VWSIVVTLKKISSIVRSPMAFAGIAVLSFMGALASPLRADPITEKEAQDIAVDAYLYFYPLITMDVTRLQSTNIEAGKEVGKGPMNAFSHIRAYPTADFRVVVRPNFDTLYSSGWLDLTKEPVVVTAPNTNGRYYLLPMLDMWSDVFASPGWRTTGTEAAKYLVTPPGWTGTVPAGIQQIPAPTPYVWVIGRTKTDGPDDYAAVSKIQDGYTITPLSQLGKKPEATASKIDPKVDMKTPPKLQVDQMDAKAYFAYAAELLKLHPPHSTDQPIIARLRRLGFEAGKSFDLSKADPVIQKAMAGAPKAGQELMAWKLPTVARIANGWSMNTDTMGVYGNYYLKRAIVAQIGLGANLPEDAIYPMNLGDAEGQPLHGDNRYVLHFPEGQAPPADAFWSVTLYDADGFQVANSLNRFALSSWMPLTYNADGSLDLIFSNTSPGPGKESNWLPAPKGPFNLLLRLYAPAPEALNGKWNPPAVTKIQSIPVIVGQ